MTLCNGNSLFGANNPYIKFNDGDIIAVEGVNTVERLMMNMVRIPYKQILKSRVILKAGQANYLLNHLGLGDNATFLAIKATYNEKAVNEEDNYVIYNYYSDFTTLHAMGKVMVLTGNSEHRIEQLYLTNPNTNYAVTLDIMVSVIDEEYSFFNDTTSNNGASYDNIELEGLETHVVNETIVLFDTQTPRNPLIYITLDNINSLTQTGDFLIIDDSSYGNILLDFGSASEAKQANSLLNYTMNNPGVIIQNLSPLRDIVDPIIYFNSIVNIGSTISVAGTSSIPVDTSMGFTFSTQITLGTFSFINNDMLSNWLISSVNDNRDGTMSVDGNNLTIYNINNDITSAIVSSGTYSVKFSVEDIAGNSVSSNVEMKIYII